MEKSRKTAFQVGLSLGLVFFVFIWLELGFYLLFCLHMPNFAAAFLVFFIDIGILGAANLAFVKWKSAPPSPQFEHQSEEFKLTLSNEFEDIGNELRDSTQELVQTRITGPIQHYYSRYRIPIMLGATLFAAAVLVQVVAPALSPKSR